MPAAYGAGAVGLGRNRVAIVQLKGMHDESLWLIAILDWKISVKFSIWCYAQTLKADLLDHLIGYGLRIND
ncbi:MAG: hypothetical protein AseanaTS_25080 [Candidatus Pelagadaptatus aseana]